MIYGKKESIEKGIKERRYRPLVWWYGTGYIYITSQTAASALL